MELLGSQLGNDAFDALMPNPDDRVDFKRTDREVRAGSIQTQARTAETALAWQAGYRATRPKVERKIPT